MWQQHTVATFHTEFLPMPPVTVTCFALSYCIAFACELTRFFFKLSIRNAIMIGFAIAGLLAHGMFLAARFQVGGNSPWYFGGIVLSAILVMAYVVASIRWPKSSIGVFMLPTSLALIGAAHAFPHDSTNEIDSLRIFGILHGIALLFGVAAVMIGFVAAIMYLIQSYRLKHKLPPRSGFWFPTLERLQRINETALTMSLGLVGIGLVVGALLNLSNSSRSIPWTDPIVLASGVWLVWLLSVVAFQFLYRAARVGQKVAYQTVVSFLFASLVLAILLLGSSEHTKSAVSVAISKIVIKRCGNIGEVQS
ncbi:hypothetical protein ACFL2H_06755 [Planctomycetota bacterium]